LRKEICFGSQSWRLGNLASNEDLMLLPAWQKSGRVSGVLAEDRKHEGLSCFKAIHFHEKGINPFE
jgi:hypothetical protein